MKHCIPYCSKYFVTLIFVTILLSMRVFTHAETGLGERKIHLWGWHQASWRMTDDFRQSIAKLSLDNQFVNSDNTSERGDHSWKASPPIGWSPKATSEDYDKAQEKLKQDFITLNAKTPGEDVYILPGNFGFEVVTKDSLEIAFMLLDRIHKAAMDAGVKAILFDTKYCTFGRVRSYPGSGGSGRNDAYILNSYSMHKGRTFHVDSYTPTAKLNWAHTVGDCEHPIGSMRPFMHTLWIEAVYKHFNVPVPDIVTNSLDAALKNMAKLNQEYGIEIVSGLNNGIGKFGSTIKVRYRGATKGSGNIDIVLAAIQRNILAGWKMTSTPYSSDKEINVTLLPKSTIYPKIYAPPGGGEYPFAAAGADSIFIMAVLGNDGVGNMPVFSQKFWVEGVENTAKVLPPYPVVSLVKSGGRAMLNRVSPVTLFLERDVGSGVNVLYASQRGKVVQISGRVLGYTVP